MKAKNKRRKTMSVQLWKVLLPALGLSIMWAACHLDQSATVENNDTESSAKFSGVVFDDPSRKLANLSVVMSSQFYQQFAKCKKKHHSPTSTTTYRYNNDYTTSSCNSNTSRYLAGQLSVKRNSNSRQPGQRGFLCCMGCSFGKIY